MIIVTPYDRGSMTAIEKAIRDSDLGVNPTDDGAIIRAVLPALTEDRRREYIKMARARPRTRRSRSVISAAAPKRSWRRWPRTAKPATTSAGRRSIWRTSATHVAHVDDAQAQGKPSSRGLTWPSHQTCLRESTASGRQSKPSRGPVLAVICRWRLPSVSGQVPSACCHCSPTSGSSASSPWPPSASGSRSSPRPSPSTASR